MSEEELLNFTNNAILRTLNITPQEIESEAFEYVKANKSKIINFFLENKNLNKNAIFMAGSLGAGRTEFAQGLSQKKNIDIIDTDEIRKICPRYTGANSSLFQKASSRGVDILLNEVYNKNYSFILDSNFADFNLQNKNIERALKRDYAVSINFIYRPLEIAQMYIKIREEKEGRKVPDDILYSGFLSSIDTINKVAEIHKDSISINYYDVTNNYACNNIENLLLRVI